MNATLRGNGPRDDVWSDHPSLIALMRVVATEVVWAPLRVWLTSA
jgi:hypothetical protein